MLAIPPEWVVLDALRQLDARESMERIYSTNGVLAEQAKEEVIYRYQRGSTALEVEGSETWNRALGPVSCRETDAYPLPEKLAIDTRSDTLLSRGERVATKGVTVLGLLASPDGKMIAVLSADGRRKYSPMPLLGRRGSSGQHYVEFFSVPRLHRIENPIFVPLTSQLGFCPFPKPMRLVRGRTTIRPG